MCVIVWRDENIDEVYGPFETETAAQDWINKQKPDRRVRYTIEVLMDPNN